MVCFVKLRKKLAERRERSAVQSNSILLAGSGIRSTMDVAIARA